MIDCNHGGQLLALQLSIDCLTKHIPNRACLSIYYILILQLKCQHTPINRSLKKIGSTYISLFGNDFCIERRGSAFGLDSKHWHTA
jgi:hypothetical protein